MQKFPGQGSTAITRAMTKLNLQDFFWGGVGALMLSYMSSLYILDTNPFSDVLLANIFSLSVGCLFILLIVSFAVQKFEVVSFV